LAVVLAGKRDESGCREQLSSTLFCGKETTSINRPAVDVNWSGRGKRSAADLAFFLLLQLPPLPAGSVGLLKQTEISPR